MKGLVVLILLFWAHPLWAEAPVYKNAEPGYRFSFPQDHRPHPGYKTEWWYYSGQLKTEGQRSERLGFQFTIFRLQRPRGVLYLFHCGLSSSEKFLSDEVLARDWPGIGGQQGSRLWVHHNRLDIQGNRHQLTSHCQGADLTLELSHQFPPVIHGERGISPKGQNKNNATHYYSVVDLTGQGSLTREGRTTKVKAEVWMDHEFGSNFMEPHQKGWDWVTLKLDSNVRLMVFQMRQEPGPNFYWATLIEPDGTYQRLKEFTFKPQGNFTSPTSRAVYPQKFQFRTQAGSLTIKPRWNNQELTTKMAGMTYFEGAVDVKGTWQGKPTQGSGYLEMTGYSGEINQKF